MDSSTKKTLITAVALSLLIHVLLLGFAYFYYSWPKSGAKESEQIIQIDLKDGWKIADIAPPKVEQKPEKSKHLGMYDSKVEEETVASQTARAPARPVSRGGEGAEKLKKEEVHKFFKPDSLPEPREEKKKKSDSKTDSIASTQQLPEDFYPDYKRGQHTYINTLKHPDVGYFVMLKHVFKLAWDPASVLRGHMMIGEVSRGNIKVVLGLSISPSGNMEELFVVNSSGIPAYDTEALRAVRASAPFASPPKKLLQNDNMLRITWTFVVYM